MKKRNWVWAVCGVFLLLCCLLGYRMGKNSGASGRILGKMLYLGKESFTMIVR